MKVLYEGVDHSVQILMSTLGEVTRGDGFTFFFFSSFYSRTYNKRLEGFIWLFQIEILSGKDPQTGPCQPSRQFNPQMSPVIIIYTLNLKSCQL